MSFNLATMLHESARSRPDRTVVISGAHRMSYAELDAASDRCATGLQAHGLRPGDPVALQLPDVAQFRDALPKNAANKVLKREL